ncbi:pantoate--beta-alanine ligase [Deferrisoma palaeochoriense]
MEWLETIDAMRAWSRAARARGKTVGFVPTMGYLHEGHLRLVARARELADRVVVSIFVNPTQFGPGEDFDRYPRDEERDRRLCEEAGVDAVFFPSAAEMYPEGYQTYVTVEEISKPLCGASRPGHFRGVATVVLKLFHAVEPDVAVFGEKDYQQLQVVRRMVRDLNLPVRIVGVPTVREADGLALSSRNTYLSDEERRQALAIPRALRWAQEQVEAGVRDPGALAGEIRSLLEGAGLRVDYAEIRHPDTLEPVGSIEDRAVLAVAAFSGRTRLIDNRVLERRG